MPGVASTGKAGIGVLFEVGDGASPEVFAAVANVTEVQAGGKTLNTEDATHLNSPNYYMEFIATLKQSDEWTFTMQWDPTDPTQAAATGLDSFLENRTLKNYRVNPSGIGLSEGFGCSAYVTALGNVQITPTGIMTRQCTIKPTGATTAVTYP